MVKALHGIETYGRHGLAVVGDIGSVAVDEGAGRVRPQRFCCFFSAFSEIGARPEAASSA